MSLKYLFISLLVSILAINCNQKTEKVSKETKLPPINKVEEPKIEHSLEYKLATVDANTYVKKDDIKIKRFRFLLDNLSIKYIEDEKKIADLTGWVTDELEKIGLKESLLNIMEGMNSLMPKNIDGQKYVEYTSLYIMLRKEGSTHSQVITRMSKITETVIQDKISLRDLLKTIWKN